MGKWLAKFSADISESRTAIADTAGWSGTLSAVAVPEQAHVAPINLPAPVEQPPLQPGWRIVYRDHQWRLAGGSDDPDHGTVDVCWREGGAWKVRLTDGQQIPWGRIRSVAAIDATGGCSGAWTVREHGYDGNREAFHQATEQVRKSLAEGDTHEEP